MTLPSQQLGEARERFAAILPRQTGAVVAGVFGCVAFLPYAAITAGSNSAIQLGDLMAMPLFAISLALSWKRRPFFLYPLILAPLLISLLKVACTGGDLALCFKCIPPWMLTGMTLVAAQLLAPAYPLQLLTGMAVATVLHVAIGLWQLYGFTTGQLPLLFLYINPSFLSVQNNADIIAKYIQRPFGLFPEPSAMSSSLAPWVVFWLAEMAGMVRLRQEPLRWQRWLFASAAVGALLLIILSRSGHAMVTLAAILALALVWFARRKATAQTLALILLVFGVILPVIAGLTFVSLSDRVGNPSAGLNSSWEERSTSLQVGAALLLHGDLPTILFGMGIGLSSPAIFAASRIQAAFSILLTYIYETGIVGALLVWFVGYHLARVWRASKFDVVFAAVFFVWLVGITLTTSYHQLLPLWITLAWLTVWPDVCAPASVVETEKALFEPAGIPHGVQPRLVSGRGAW